MIECPNCSGCGEMPNPRDHHEMINCAFCKGNEEVEEYKAYEYEPWRDYELDNYLSWCDLQYDIMRDEKE